MFRFLTLQYHFSIQLYSTSQTLILFNISDQTCQLSRTLNKEIPSYFKNLLLPPIIILFLKIIPCVTIQRNMVIKLTSVAMLHVLLLHLAHIFLKTQNHICTILVLYWLVQTLPCFLLQINVEKFLFCLTLVFQDLCFL